MPPEAWQAISAIVAALAAAGSAVSVALIARQHGEVKRSAEAAEAARDNTVPISNGFASGTTAALAEINERSQRNAATLEWVVTALGRHLAAHDAGAACPAGLTVLRSATARPPGYRGDWPPTPPGGEELPTDEGARSDSHKDYRSH